MASAHKLNGGSAAWPEVAFSASPARMLALLAGSVALTLGGAALFSAGSTASSPGAKHGSPAGPA